MIVLIKYLAQCLVYNRAQYGLVLIIEYLYIPSTVTYTQKCFVKGDTGYYHPVFMLIPCMAV